MYTYPDYWILCSDKLNYIIKHAEKIFVYPLQILDASIPTLAEHNTNMSG